MTYFLTFFEGVLAFISPCLLPMVPIYLSILGVNGERKVMKNAISFVLGFSILFIILGVFSGSIGSLLNEYTRVVEIVGGILIILFGLIYLDIVKLSFIKSFNYQTKQKYDIISAFVFGMVFSICWTPCVGAFLGSALTIAANSANPLEGGLLLLAYSAGMGLPFLLTAFFFEELKGTFNFIKKHYGVIIKVSGIILILTGLLMISGLFGNIFGGGF